jgi:hypothetical protein
MTKKMASLLACVLATLAGCGGGSSSPAEAHLAAAANAVCSNAQGMGSHAEIGKQIARFRALLDSDRELPHVETLISDSAALQATETRLAQVAISQISPVKRGHVAESVSAGTISLLRKSHQLKAEVYADENGLGIACLGRFPRKPIKG